MISHKHTANAVGDKTARACDRCIRKRAGWYCAADDAFLCLSCDGTVHSANPLARRHERVRLKTASLRHLNCFPNEKGDKDGSVPSWHRGFTKKARTPRHGKAALLSTRNPEPLVPEFDGDDTSNEESEERLLYQVPTYDPFAAELYSSKEPEISPPFDVKESKGTPTPVDCYGVEVEGLHGFLPTDMELAEFAADVQSLLGKGLDDESSGMEGLGLMDCDKEREKSLDCPFGSEKLVKIEEEGILAIDLGEDDGVDIDISKEIFELNFDDYDYPTTCGKEEDEKVAELETKTNVEDRGKDGKNRIKIFLKLDYESVISSWATQGSPWTSGDRPDFSSDNYWPDCLGIYGELPNQYGKLVVGGIGYEGHIGMGDTAGREAKVSRYREKRRTRLFSKKIRYEVRKLNAEKRPRMKGRFVKRPAPFSGPTSFPLLSK